MNHIHFEYPWLFLLLIPYAVLLFFLWRRKEPALRVPSLTPFRRVGNTAVPFPWRKAIPFFFIALAGVLLITALTRPRKGLELIRSRAEGIDIILAVDLSDSMAAMDVPGHLSGKQLERKLSSGEIKNRLEISKDEIAKFVMLRPNDRIGLIAFADRPYVICPPTLDHAFLLANLMRMQPAQIGSATGIAGPVASAVKRLKESEAKSRIVVLFTDGANTADLQVTPMESAKLADSFEITIYTVGIGSGNAVIEQRTPFGSQYIAYSGQYDEALLQEMAAVTGGKYYHAADAAGLEAAMKEIDQLEKTSAEQPLRVRWKEYYPTLALAAAILILLAGLTRNTVCLRYP